MKQYQKLLRDELEKSGNYCETADKLGVSSTIIHNWISGARVPKAISLELLSKVLDYPMGGLLLDADDKPTIDEQIIHKLKDMSTAEKEAILTALKNRSET